MGVLEGYKFDQTAKCVFNKELKDYDRLLETLKFMSVLKCPKPCRDRKDTVASCPIRECCIERGFYACYECDELEACDKLNSFMKGLHAEANLKNLKAIKEMGLDVWIRKGKRYHYWDEEDD